QVVLRLRDYERSVSPSIGDPERGAGPPGGIVRHRDVTGLSGANEVVERAHRLFEGSRQVIRVNVEKIDIVGLKPCQTTVNSVQNVRARRPAVVWAIAHFHSDLGGEKNGRATIYDRLTDVLFG